MSEELKDIDVIDAFNSSKDSAIDAYSILAKHVKNKRYDTVKLVKDRELGVKIIVMHERFDEKMIEEPVIINENNRIVCNVPNPMGLTPKHEYTPFKIYSRFGFPNTNLAIFSLSPDYYIDSPFFRVADTYYKKIEYPQPNGSKELKLVAIKRQTLLDDYGKEILDYIPKYHGFCNYPDYFNYEQIKDNLYNLFNGFAYPIKEGKWDTIKQLIKHIFGEQYEMGLDYLKILIEMPYQQLPVLSLVSAENGTGKTTFVDFLAYWLKGNVAIIGTKDISSSFNSYWCSAHVIAIDESDLNKQHTTDLIKMLATSKTIFRKAKFENEEKIDFFAKLILISNQEFSFVNAKEHDTRFWVRKVGKVENFDPDFLQRCVEEIPAFTAFLRQRELQTKEAKGRAWFSDEDYNTEWLEALKAYNRSELFQELTELFNTFFAKSGQSFINARASDIREYFFNSTQKSKYTNKYLSKVLKEEFKINPILKIDTTNLTNSMNPEQDIKGRWFHITKEQVENL